MVLTFWKDLHSMALTVASWSYSLLTMLLNNADYTELNDKTIIKWWTGKNAEESGLGVVWDTTMVCG